MKFKVVVERIEKEEYEFFLEGNSCMSAFDEARKLTVKRNKVSKNGQFYVTKVIEQKE